MHLLGLLLIPIIVSGTMFFLFKLTITWKEFILQLGLSVIVVASGYYLTKWLSLLDTEHLNGYLTDKQSGTQKCCHCIQVCNSRDSKGNCTSYREQCSHFHDYWWSLDSTVGSIPIESCSGSNFPPDVWVRAQIGEPAVVEHSYTNYLLADPDSLIVHSKHGQYINNIPKYPEVYDYYKVNPVLSDRVPIPSGWQEEFRKINAELGSLKQVDITVLLTVEKDPIYAQAVEAKWLYGPKNSFTIVLGIEDSKVIWARGISISKVENLKILVRDVLSGKEINNSSVPFAIRNLISDWFTRTPMSEFEYLAKTASPSAGWLICLYILSLVLSIGLGVVCHCNDIFGNETINLIHFIKMKWRK